MSLWNLEISSVLPSLFFHFPSISGSDLDGFPTVCSVFPLFSISLFVPVVLEFWPGCFQFFLGFPTFPRFFNFSAVVPRFPRVFPTVFPISFPGFFPTCSTFFLSFPIFFPVFSPFSTVFPSFSQFSHLFPQFSHLFPSFLTFFHSFPIFFHRFPSIS